MATKTKQEILDVWSSLGLTSNKNTNIGYPVLANTHILNSMITVSNSNQQEVFRIGVDGDIHWLCNGEMRKIESDDELALMFCDVITNLAQMSPSAYRNKVKKEVEKEFYDNMPIKMKRKYKIHKLTQ